MEITPLFYSSLPTDCIKLIYDKLVYQIRKIPKDLKEELELFMYIKEPLESLDFVKLGFLEHELMYTLNNYTPYNTRISPCLQDDYPNMSIKLLHGLYQKDIKSSIFKVWSLMNKEKKKKYIKQSLWYRRSI